MLSQNLRISLVLSVCLACPLLLAGCPLQEESSGIVTPAAAGECLFCHWNVENFFDDHADKRHHKADKEFDAWFSKDPKAFQEKLGKLTEAILKMNNGKGPDILCLVEVESPRAAGELMAALNARLDVDHHYQHVLMKDLDAGRHIAPAILTRLPVDDTKTSLHGHMQRILEGHVVVHGHDLVILATHWTSRLTEGSEKGREHYADVIAKTVKDYLDRDPHTAIVVCGDFNDTPQDESVVKHLHSSSDLNAVRQNRAEPLLFNLFAAKDPSGGFGTHYYNGKWYIFDQILVSPALLGSGAWTCEVDTATTFNQLYKPGDAHKRPWRFGEENTKAPRGYSDHFPVTVKLRVAG